MSSVSFGRLALAPVLIGIAIWAIIDGGYYAGRAWGILGICVLVTVGFIVFHFRRARKKRLTLSKSLKYAFDEAVTGWFRK